LLRIDILFYKFVKVLYAVIQKEKKRVSLVSDAMKCVE